MHKYFSENKITIILFFISLPLQLVAGNLENTFIPFWGRVTLEQAALARGVILVVWIALSGFLVLRLVADLFSRLVWDKVYKFYLSKLSGSKVPGQRMPWLALGNPNQKSTKTFSVGTESFLFETNIKIIDNREYWRAGVELVDEKNDKVYFFHLAVGGDYATLFYRSTASRNAGRKDVRQIFGSSNGSSNRLGIRKEGNLFTFLINGQEVDSYSAEGWKVNRIDLSAWGDQFQHSIFFDDIFLTENTT